MKCNLPNILSDLQYIFTLDIIDYIYIYIYLVLMICSDNILTKKDISDKFKC